MTDDTPPPVSRQDVDSFKRRLFHHLKHTVAKNPETATSRDWYAVTAHTVRDLLVETWMDSVRQHAHDDAKHVYYLSLEFLIGRSLDNNLLASGFMDVCRATFADMGLDFDGIRAEEPEAALGNGGLGRLAACFMDSLATLGIPGIGYGIHYHHGMFRQEIRDGAQVEVPENWLILPNPWDFERPEFSYPIRFGGWVEQCRDAVGRDVFRWHGVEEVTAAAVDVPVAGYGGFSANSIRLWAACARHGFDLGHFNRGDYLEAVMAEVESESLSRVLYPDDSTSQGKTLRFKQEYFFAAASLADILRRFQRAHGDDFARLPEKVAIQLNDTHPAIAVAELMRLLVDDHHLGWDTAWDLCVGVFAYTNHTLLPEALETWPVRLFEAMLPRHLQIIYEINGRFLDRVRATVAADDGLARRLSLIQEGDEKRVRMAHLAFVGSHRVNGVARLHTDLMTSGIFADLHRVFPDRIVNKTNGITPRRWLNEANRPLSRLITDTLGDGWQSDLEALRKLVPLAEDTGFRDAFAAVKQANKDRLATWANKALDRAIDPDSLFDVQVKRIHEYKRQLLNVLHVISRYNRARAGRLGDAVPRTVIFAGKAAPGYAMAKLIIRLITGVAETIDRDPRAREALRVLFVPNYDVSTAERLIPAADLSQQISLAGTEASGTGNMKLALNGALTIGTRDGANIEIAEEVGEENVFFFGLSAEEAAALQASGNHNPWRCYTQDPDLAEALDMIREGAFAGGDKTVFQPIFDSLTAGGDRYLLLADYADYMATQARVDAAWTDRAAWTASAVLNTARMGKFSSDVTILDYARDVWGVKGSSPAAQGMSRRGEELI
jgi:starch phosphorylase